MTTELELVDAIEAGRVVVIPTDTVYGLAVRADTEPAVRALYFAKGRPETQPTALLAASLDVLFGLLPELEGDVAVVAQALLPGPFTLVVPNPARRFRWLNGDAAETIGVRVPVLPGPARAVLDAVGSVAATSANAPGGRDPRTVGEIPGEIVARVSGVLDIGVLPGVPSTVIDITGAEPVVVRAGAVPGDVALARIAAALTAS